MSRFNVCYINHDNCTCERTVFAHSRREAEFMIVFDLKLGNSASASPA